MKSLGGLGPRVATSAAILFSIVTASGISGCDYTGTVNNENEWSNELSVAFGDLKEKKAAATQTLRAAFATGDLEAAADAYGNYASDVGEVEDQLQGIDTPEACQDEQAALEGMISTIRKVSEELSDPAVLGSQRQFAAVLSDAAPLLDKYGSTIQEAVAAESC